MIGYTNTGLLHLKGSARTACGVFAQLRAPSQTAAQDSATGVYLTRIEICHQKKKNFVGKWRIVNLAFVFETELCDVDKT